MDESRQMADQGAKIGMRMLQHINQAMAAVDPQLVMQHVREGMADGEDLEDLMDRIMDIKGENTALRDRIDNADNHRRQAMTEGGEALTASGDFIKSHVESMKKHIDEMLGDLNAATLPIVR